jgi:hypothetical protein
MRMNELIKLIYIYKILYRLFELLLILIRWKVILSPEIKTRERERESNDANWS